MSKSLKCIFFTKSQTRDYWSSTRDCDKSSNRERAQSSAAESQRITSRMIGGQLCHIIDILKFLFQGYLPYGERNSSFFNCWNHLHGANSEHVEKQKYLITSPRHGRHMQTEGIGASMRITNKMLVLAPSASSEARPQLVSD